MSEKKRCIATVYSRGDVWHRPKCKNAATIGDYCKTHDPETRKAKGRARDEQWQAELDAKEAAREKADRIREAEQEVIRVAKWWAEQVSSDSSDDRLMDAINALKEAEAGNV